MVELGLTGEIIRRTEHREGHFRERMRYAAAQRKKGEYLGTIVKHSVEAGVGGGGAEVVKGKHVAGGEMKALSWIQITKGLICHVKEFCLVPPGIGVLLKDFKQRAAAADFLFWKDDLPAA